MNTYFLERGQTGRAEIALRFPLPRVLIDGLTIEKRVTVHLNYLKNGAGGHRFTIAWEPLGKGPLPSFDGTLTASEETDATCRIGVAGSYAPPGGVAGVLFDRLVGIHIANATITALLDQFRDAIERDYAVRLVP